MGGVCVLLLAFFALISCSACRVFGQSCEGNFSLSCSNVQLQGTSSLQAMCEDSQGGFETTLLDLNTHITNDNGNLECSSANGAFSATCRSISLTASNVLAANCFDTNGNLVGASVDLDQCVQNTNGQLSWACVSS